MRTLDQNWPASPAGLFCLMRPIMPLIVGLMRGNFGLMIDERKTRPASPLANLGAPGMSRRIAGVAQSVEQPPCKRKRAGSKPAAGTKTLDVAGSIPASPAKRGRGRPATGDKPWIAAGVSKATWFRQKKART